MMDQVQHRALLRKVLLEFITEKDPVLAMLERIAHQQADRKSPRRAADQMIQEYSKRFPEAIRCLDEGLRDSPQFCGFPKVDLKRISLTNMPERVIQEARRRSREVGLSPPRDFWVSLETCYLMEISEDRRTDRSYIKREKIQRAMGENRSFLQA